MYYGARLFEQAGIEDPLQTQLILGAVNVAMTFYGLYVVEKFGRRWPLFIGALWQATWLIIYAAVAVALPPQENEAAGIMLIVATCLFIASFAGTWGPMAWVVIGETFPQRTRAKQASLATAGNWLGNCKLPHITLGYADEQSWLPSSLPWQMMVSATTLVSSSLGVISQSPSSSGSSSTRLLVYHSRMSIRCILNPNSNLGLLINGCRLDTSLESSETQSLSVMRSRELGVMNSGMESLLNRLSRRGSTGKEVIARQSLLLL